MRPKSEGRIGQCALIPKGALENFFMTPIDSTHQDKPICTLEYMVWPIRTGRNLPLKIQYALSNLYSEKPKLFYFMYTKSSLYNNVNALTLARMHR